MNTALPGDVVVFAAGARSRLQPLGGARLALRAETDRSLRESVALALRDLGVDDLQVRADLDQFLAAAQLCRVAGAMALPWPVVEDLMRIDGSRLALVDLTRPRVDHGDLGGDWLGADLHGVTYRLVIGTSKRAKLGPFLVPAECGARATAVDGDDIARHLVLGSWRILGGLEEAVSQVVAHVGVRKQFGKALAEFQTVRFAVADVSVALRGLDELAKHASWRLTSAPGARCVADAVALRLYAVDTAITVLRTCHQLLGAVGFCDEHDVSVFDRHLQPLLRLPLSADRLAQHLVPSVRSGDLQTLFS